MKTRRKQKKKNKTKRIFRKKGGMIYEKPLSEQLFNTVKMGQLGRLKKIIESIENERNKNNHLIIDIVNLYDDNNKNLLYYAYDGGHDEIVDYLLEKGAHDEEYILDNVLTNAIKKNDVNTVAKLLEKDASDVSYYQYNLANSLYKNYQDENLNEKFNKITKLIANQIHKKNIKKEGISIIKAKTYNPDIFIPEENIHKFVDTQEIDIPINDTFITEETALEPVEAIEVPKNKYKRDGKVELQPYEEIPYEQNSKIQKSIRFGGKKRRGHRGTLVPHKKKNVKK